MKIRMKIHATLSLVIVFYELWHCNKLLSYSMFIHTDWDRWLIVMNILYLVIFKKVLF